MPKIMKLGNHSVGEGQPVYIIGEIGINHNGSLDTTLSLIDMAKAAGCDAVKFQKRTPEVCVPEDQRDKMRETPWGYITYMEYRYKVEFSVDDYKEIDNYCRAQDIDWFVSAWDPGSIDVIKSFNTPCLKIPSASLTDRELLEAARDSGMPVMLSSGMSNTDQIEKAVELVGVDNILLAHATSTYPCPNEQLNLKCIPKLAAKYDCPIGYSGHEVGLVTTAAAVALGATFVERHITLDRAMWGSDQAASVEGGGLKRLVKDIRNVEAALGDGVKIVYESEARAAERLRLKNTL